MIDICTTQQIGQRDMLINYRKKAHITQEQLARVAGVSQVTISRIERAQLSGIAVHSTTNAGLHRALGEDADEILRGVTITTSGKSAGEYGAPGDPAPRQVESCDTCGYVLPLTSKCDFCGD